MAFILYVLSHTQNSIPKNSVLLLKGGHLGTDDSIVSCVWETQRSWLVGKEFDAFPFGDLFESWLGRKWD